LEALKREICIREAPKPSAVARHIDPDLDNIVLMALRKEPQRRYASVDQFSQDIQLYLEGRPIRARKDTLRYRAGKFLRRNRLGVTLAALALIGVITGVLAVERQARRAELRFRQVRKLSNTVLFDLNSEIESLAGSTKARELLVRTSLEYLDSLRRRRQAILRYSWRWRAPEKVGDVQGNPLLSNLGHPKASLESYGKAMAIAEGLGSSQSALELVARSYYKRGCAYNWVLGRFSDAGESLRLAIRIADVIPKKNRATCLSCPRQGARVPGGYGDVPGPGSSARATDPFPGNCPRVGSSPAGFRNQVLPGVGHEPVGNSVARNRQLAGSLRPCFECAPPYRAAPRTTAGKRRLETRARRCVRSSGLGDRTPSVHQCR
jgi:hypothetical protein